MSLSKVRKYGGFVQVSAEMLNPRGPRVITPEEEVRLREHKRKAAAATAAWPSIVAALDAVTDPMARAVLDLHASDDGYCRGCEFGGYEAESPPWPCNTTTTVAAILGIPGAEDMWLAEQVRV